MQVVDDDQEDAAGRVIARPRRRQDDPFLRRRRRCRLEVVDAAAVHQRQRGNVLFDAVLEDFEIVFREVGDELILVVPDDGVHRHEIDPGPEVWLPGRRWLCRRSRGRLRRRRRLGAGAPWAANPTPAAKAKAKASPNPKRVRLSCISTV